MSQCDWRTLTLNLISDYSLTSFSIFLFTWIILFHTFDNESCTFISFLLLNLCSSLEIRVRVRVQSKPFLLFLLFSCKHSFKVGRFKDTHTLGMYDSLRRFLHHSGRCNRDVSKWRFSPTNHFFLPTQRKCEFKYCTRLPLNGFYLKLFNGYNFKGLINICTDGS